MDGFVGFMLGGVLGLGAALHSKVGLSHRRHPSTPHSKSYLTECIDSLKFILWRLQ